ncbi:zinc dependent phospholipase C family protein [Desnuesiella massiliensis]|uniref:zinc dependent phospholipase C family protein n=1 Tax=Desnuesiella massiliensis TaxID=1650662 RepID=UPI0006E2D79B|nr:zinc dependent phospholipase C family protein [Desnuesiella massiliensis]
MSFVMTHLAVAKGINDKITIARNLNSFYLGTISPDCVHVRKDYNRDMKKNSHYCVGNEGWCMVTNNQEWRDNTLSLLRSYRNHPDFDFFLGYFIHILVDISDNEKIYIPFKEKYTQEGLPLQDRGRAFYNDKSQNDFGLFNFYKWKNEVWTLLADSQGVDIRNIIEAKEAEEYRDIVLHQYDSGVSPYSEPIKFILMDDNIKFIENTIDEIIELLNYAL